MTMRRLEVRSARETGRKRAKPIANRPGNDIAKIKERLKEEQSQANIVKNSFLQKSESKFFGCPIFNLIRMPSGDSFGLFVANGVSGDFKIVDEQIHWRQMKLNKSGNFAM